MTQTFDPRVFIEETVAALNSKDAGRFLRSYADDAEFVDPSLARPVRGKQAIRENFEAWARAFADVDFRVKEVVGSGDRFALLLDARGRHAGPLDIGAGTPIPATGKTVRLEMAEFLKIGRDGKVTSDHTLFDLAKMVEQLGIETPMRM